MKRKILLVLVVSGLLIGLAAGWAALKNPVIEQKQGVYLGVFREGAPQNMNHIVKFEEQTGIKPSMVMWYQDWAQNFPRQAAENAVAYGAVPHIVWEPWYWSDHSKVQLKDIIDGKWDAYIRTWAQEIRAFKRPIFIRMAHEFNIEGYPWGIINNNKDPQIYIDAYRHVVDIFKKEKADNAKWVWCFMNYSYPKEAWNDWEKAYPGDKYVDWIGIDGYNWGTVQDWSEWQAFKYLFRDQARRCKQLWPDKPIMVAEFSSAEKGGNKAAWIREIPEYLKTSMRDIDLIIWFDIKKEADWRVKSSNQSLAAFQET
ncbi:MAG: glycosyl hydrolase, partial [Candidatus Margulisiibacteriota bacterium]